MACLYKRKSKFWVSYRINGKLVQQSLNTDCKRVAREKVRQIEYELSRGELQQVSRLGLPSFLQKYCQYLSANRTYKSYKNDFGRLRSFFGPVCESLEIRPPGSPLSPRGRPQRDKCAGRHLDAKRLEDLTPAAINRWMDARGREENWSPKTANNYRQVLHRMFNYAIKRHNFVSRDRRFPKANRKRERIGEDYVFDGNVFGHLFRLKRQANTGPGIVATGIISPNDVLLLETPPNRLVEISLPPGTGPAGQTDQSYRPRGGS